MAARGPKIPGARSSEENRDFLKFIRPVTTLWVLQSSQIVQMVSKEILLARAVFTRLIRLLGWQPSAPKPREHDFPKKTSYFFEIHRTSDSSMGSVSLRNHAYGLYGTSTSQSSVCKVNLVLRWQPGAPKFREHDFPKKTCFFELHRTSDTSMGSVSLRKHACGLSGTSASQGSVYKVN